MATNQFKSSKASTIAVMSTAGASTAFPVWLVEIHLADGTRRYATLDIALNIDTAPLTGAGMSAGESAGEL